MPRRRLIAAGLVSCLALGACLSPYEARHTGHWDAGDEIWLAEDSQVKLRAAQSRVFDTVDKNAILAAVVATMQDLNFVVEVLDEELGIATGTRFDAIERPEPFYDPSYHLYDDYTLVAFTRGFATWGPFFHRNDLVRLTVTVRQRNAAQSVVRASAQYYLRAVEDPEPYQRFFRALAQALFLDAAMLEG